MEKEEIPTLHPLSSHQPDHFIEDLLVPSLKHHCSKCQDSLIGGRVAARRSLDPSGPPSNYCIPCFATLNSNEFSGFLCKDPHQLQSRQSWQAIEIVELMNCVCKYGTSSWPVVQQELNRLTGSSRMQAEIADKYWQIYAQKFKGKEGLDQSTKLSLEEVEQENRGSEDYENAQLEKEFNAILDEVNLSSLSGVSRRFVELLLSNQEVNTMLNDQVAEGQLACLQKWAEQSEWERSRLKSSNLHLCRLYIHMSHRTNRRTRQRHEDKLVPFSLHHHALSRLLGIGQVQGMMQEAMVLREERRALLQRRHKRVIDS